MSTSRPPSSTGELTPESTSSTTQLADSTSPPSRTPRRRRRRIYRPAENSLYDLIHQHAGLSLFVRPICWTDLHVQLLGARFIELPPCDTPQPSNIAGSPPSKGHMRPSLAIRSLSDALTNLMTPAPIHPLVASNSVRTVLSTLWPEAVGKPSFIPELHLFFGGRVYREAVRAQLMWNYPTEGGKSACSSFRSVSTRPATSFNVSSATSYQDSNRADLPMLCYIGKTQLASIRTNLFRVVAGPNKTWNEPVYRLQQLRARALIPSDPNHDPHFVGLFIAMAQRHFYDVPRPSARRNSQWASSQDHTSSPEFRDVKLRLLSHDPETAEFLVYTAFVTAKFLQRFHEPFKAPRDDDENGVPGLKIEYTRVPVWPILGLRERLGKALGEDMVGSFDPDEIETWEEDIPDSQKEGAGKRKREALAEVFNGSFDETSSSNDEPTLGGKKRCLSEGSPIGVVN